MKKPASKLTLLATAFAVVSLFTVPALRAADEKEAKDKKDKEPKVTAKVLEKYDKNHNGKLDPDEEAAWKADLAKAKEKKEEKKEKKEEKKEK
jgi:hypothetical protein